MEKTIEFYNDVIQYLLLNYLNLGFVLLFVIIGFVKDINIRETQIKTPDGKDVFFPTP